MSKQNQKFFFRHQRVKKASRDRKRLSNAFQQLKSNVRKNTQMLRQTVEGKQIYLKDVVEQPMNSFRYYNLMDGLAQGVADTGTGATVSTGARIGNSINVKSITCNMLINGTNLNPEAIINQTGKSAGVYRLIIYNSPCGELLSSGDILRNNDDTEAALKSHYQISVEQGKMYEIWYDKVHTLSDAKPTINVDFIKKWKDGKKVLFDNDAVQPSNFYPRVMLIGVSNVNGDKFHYSFKVRYEDL